MVRKQNIDGRRGRGATRAGRVAWRLAAAGGAALTPALAHAAFEWNLQRPVTPMAQQMMDLHNYIFWICVVIFIGVFGTMFYSIFKHRKSVGHQAAQFHENTTVEIVWTVIPFLILMFMAWPATKTILAMKDTSAPDMTVKVTGYQWKWGYDYMQDGFSYYSQLATPIAQVQNQAPKGPNYLLEVDNPLVVPVDTKVRVILTANDVIHSWWVPAFGVKQDAIPGFVRDTWFKAEKTGIYRGQCAELCGKDHGFMPVVVEVKSKEDYAAWVGQQKQKMAAAADDPNKTWTEAELVAKGATVYAANCVACHQASGKGVPGAFPALEGSKIVNGPPEGQIDIVLNGKPGTEMPSWKSLSDADIASVITYTRNSFGNHAGDVMPAQVKAARK
ncbi:MAG: cytochrome c oxidase subunit II [Burkholderiales bacterium]